MNDQHVQRASRLIARLQVRFPNAFGDMKREPKMMMLMAEEWAFDLAGLSDEQINYGLSVLRDSGSKFAPSLPEFVAMCKPPVADASHRLVLPAPEYEPLPKEVHEENMRNLRAVISSTASSLSVH